MHNLPIYSSRGENLSFLSSCLIVLTQQNMSTSSIAGNDDIHVHWWLLCPGGWLVLELQQVQPSSSNIIQMQMKCKIKEVYKSKSPMHVRGSISTSALPPNNKQHTKNLDHQLSAIFHDNIYFSNFAKTATFGARLMSAREMKCKINEESIHNSPMHMRGMFIQLLQNI